MLKRKKNPLEGPHENLQMYPHTHPLGTTDILLMTFSYLGLFSIFNCRKVCTKWRNTINNGIDLTQVKEEIPERETIGYHMNSIKYKPKPR